MYVVAIDPGNIQSAIAVFDSKKQSLIKTMDLPKGADTFDNVVLLTLLQNLCKTNPPTGVVVCEKIASYGMPVGETIFETVFWSGRFAQAIAGKVRFERIERKEVKLHLCGTPRAKDGNVRQTLIDRFGPQGTKKKPGVLYGIKKDQWAALAVAVTWADKYANNSND